MSEGGGREEDRQTDRQKDKRGGKDSVRTLKDIACIR